MVYNAIKACLRTYDFVTHHPPPVGVMPRNWLIQKYWENHNNVVTLPVKAWPENVLCVLTL